MKMRRIVIGAGAAIVLGSAAAAITIAPRWTNRAAADVPTTRVVRGALKLDVHVTGELRARRSVTLMSPAGAGPARLVRLAETGAAVRAGDVVMEFDPVDQQHTLEQSRSQLLEAEQEITKMRIDGEVQAAQAQVDLLTARFDLRRAEMAAAAGQDLIGAIEAMKRALTVEEARRQLTEMEGRVQTRAETSRAALATVEEKRNKARLMAERAQRIIDSLAVSAPIDGLAVVRENRDTTSLFFNGMTLPEYRVGDTVLPGRIVLEIVDADDIEIRARVSEQNRPNVAARQLATVHADALAGEPLAARVVSLAGLASRSSFFDGSGPVRQFDAVLQLDQPDPRLRPGTTVRVVIAGREMSDVLHVPRQALFEDEKGPVVYVREDGRFQPRAVKPIGGGETRVAIEGIADGAEIALVRPAAGDSRKPPIEAAGLVP